MKRIFGKKRLSIPKNEYHQRILWGRFIPTKSNKQKLFSSCKNITHDQGLNALRTSSRFSWNFNNISILLTFWYPQKENLHFGFWASKKLTFQYLGQSGQKLTFWYPSRNLKQKTYIFVGNLRKSHQKFFLVPSSGRKS